MLLCHTGRNHLWNNQIIIWLLKIFKFPSYTVLHTTLHMESREREGRCVRYRLNHQHNQPVIQVYLKQKLLYFLPQLALVRIVVKTNKQKILYSIDVWVHLAELRIFQLHNQVCSRNKLQLPQSSASSHIAWLSQSPNWNIAMIIISRFLIRHTYTHSLTVPLNNQDFHCVFASICLPFIKADIAIKTWNAWQQHQNSAPQFSRGNFTEQLQQLGISGPAPIMPATSN